MREYIEEYEDDWDDDDDYPDHYYEDEQVDFDPFDENYYSAWDEAANPPHWYTCRECNGIGHDPYGMPCEKCAGRGTTSRLMYWLKNLPVSLFWQSQWSRAHFPIRKCADCGRIYWDARQVALCPDDNCLGSIPF